MLPVQPEAGEALPPATTKISSHLRWRGSGKIRKSNSRMAQPNSASITAGMIVKWSVGRVELAHIDHWAPPATVGQRRRGTAGGDTGAPPAFCTAPPK